MCFCHRKTSKRYVIVNRLSFIISCGWWRCDDEVSCESVGPAKSMLRKIGEYLEISDSGHLPGRQFYLFSMGTDRLGPPEGSRCFGRWCLKVD